MIVRITGAFLRALLIALAIATPAILLPDIGPDSAQVVLVVALVAAGFVFAEYFSQFPTLIEFRFAPPVNRLRYFTAFAMILLLTVNRSEQALDTPIADLLGTLGHILVDAIDFPYSPVRLVLLALPDDTDPARVEAVRQSAGIAYLTGLSGLIAFGLLVRVYGWPARYGSFNVWINLPLFDPTGGGDVLSRLKRDSSVNIVLGFLLPFLLPAVVKLCGPGLGAKAMDDPQSLIWTMVAWAFIPVNLIMRGVALGQLAAMIEQQRRRTYAAAKAEILQTA
ncbi:hypothetical protein [Pseudooceanicola aestuarii]|uniref:hypothetical protein n=1 Tax=Pseudooceanicola aestuarii TaxID=2697319 RepID=UPI001EF78AD6|nr:hypothetical protein [Pseudooceanicola aestuarii]